MTWIKENDFVARRVVVFLVACEENVGAQIREHLAYAMNKDVRMLVAIVGINMLVNFLAYKADKAIRVGLCGQFVCYHVGMYLVFLKVSSNNDASPNFSLLRYSQNTLNKSSTRASTKFVGRSSFSLNS